MSKKECLAMLLAGGQGSRLGALTRSIAKPAVSFGGKYRIIDFALSNCANSDINTVGVLTQYKPYLLHSYIGTGAAWNLDERGAGISILPPYATETGGSWYAGTADAIYQNIGYIESNDPEYVLILSGDHLYSMDYRKMLDVHVKNNADLTISVMPVAWDEASRFGIITKDEDDSVLKFTEKPAQPDSNLASMGIYIFSTDVLVKALKEDAADPESEHDFGNNIIPRMLEEGRRIFCYEFHGFWRDVGTIASYKDTAMLLLGSDPEFNLYDKNFPIMSNAPTRRPHLIGASASVDDSLVANGCGVFGTVSHSILSTDSYVGPRAIVEDSILLPGAKVKAGAHVVNAILGEGAVVEENAKLGSVDKVKDTVVVGDDVVVGKGEE
ncbi:glucose-1-phosphate adenylyltransferase [Olsenella sp. YH-ols2217]|uniref:Glucose-1-phosphate adenylyltransferase n=1 Tax=Kribbibacterium absianum TaxID=3044210 RepID=A0ABT6ZJ48_9ACTN|nr:MULTISPECIES: glucose-1-phosphate adenylyltransferase [unclassified Olsenella]MDJ1122644.1 glucose-1-phosphate adenylyltransferase [Olsenella sp. YH-ols2216]MDJ1129082.1 glucose-1-phosphate adenylyltransferase [Olsenella sp. YH-ols2217]